MIITQQTADLTKPFKQGKVFAYPTEAVYGLGCDPDNKSAVMRLLEIKNRSISKGLIIIASDFSQVEKYLQPLLQTQIAFTTPSENTYIFPALDSAPKWITGDFNSLAIRITIHLIARELCQILDSALVSTSANLEGLEPAKTAEAVLDQLGNKVDIILEGALGDLQSPTKIFDSLTGEVIRF